jgi:hypothetical protein
MVELGAVPIGFVGGFQPQSHRRILLVAVVKEQNIVGVESAGGVGIKIFLPLLTDLPEDYVAQHAVFECHRRSMTERQECGAVDCIARTTSSRSDIPAEHLARTNNLRGLKR